MIQWGTTVWVFKGALCVPVGSCSRRAGGVLPGGCPQAVGLVGQAGAAAVGLQP